MKIMKKTISFLLAAALSLAVLAGCSSQSSAGSSSEATPSGGAGTSSAASAESAASAASDTAPSKPLKDREGNDLVIPDTLDRIISTAPSNTEELIGLGLSEKLVAVDKYSADVEGISSDLPLLDFVNPDAEAIINLKPDIIIASGHNKVGGEDPFALIKEAGICVAYIPSSDSIQGVCDDITFLGQVTGTEDAAEKLVADYTKQVEEIRAIGATIPEAEKKTVYFEIDQLYSFGKNTFLNEFIETVGAKNIFADQEGWVAASAEAVVEANPDIILTNVSYIEDSVGEIKGRDGWNAINAIKNDAVYLIDTNASSRPSQNSIKALREIAKAIYPSYYE